MLLSLRPKTNTDVWDERTLRWHHAIWRSLVDFDRIRLWFEAGERETSSSSCQLNLVFQGEHSFGRSWRLGISCEKKPVKNEPLSVRHGGEVLNGPKRPLILRSSAHPIVGERSGDSNELHGQRRSVVSMSPWLLLYLPPQRSPQTLCRFLQKKKNGCWNASCCQFRLSLARDFKDSFRDCPSIVPP